MNSLPAIPAILPLESHGVCLEETIALFTKHHSLTLRKSISNLCKREINNNTPEYLNRVELLLFKTYLGGDIYWYGLFKKISGRFPTHPTPLIDTEVWNTIIPIGYRELQKIEGALPSHAGEFYYPLPIPIFTGD